MGKFPCSGVVLTLSSGRHMYNAILCYPPPPTLLLGRMPPFFLYDWRRDPLLCYPPLHYCWGRCCPFFIRLAARSSTPPYTSGGANAARFLYGWLNDPLLCYPPYDTIRADATRLFSYGWLRDPLLCYPRYTPVGRPFTVLPPTLHLGEMLPVLVR